MTTAALFIDLPNFYSRLLKSGLDEPRLLRDYFVDWLDLDLLAEALLAESMLDSYLGTWVFYSGERVGPSGERISREHLEKYVARINALRGVTAYDVNIEGKQREPVRLQCRACGHEDVKFKCSQCGEENPPESMSEKGIDTSLAVHLFDTMDSWDVAFLLSGDADFVPVVASLRRRGKIVIGAGFPDASAALIRECYDYVDLRELFLKEDTAAYSIFRKDGIACRWLTDEVIHDPDYPPSPTVEVKAWWYERRGSPDRPFGFSLSVEEAVDMLSRMGLVLDFQDRFPDQFGGADTKRRTCSFRFSPLTWQSVERRLGDLLTSLEGAKRYGSGASYHVQYQYNDQTGKYELVNH